MLLYGTAGVAYGQVKDTATMTAPGASVTGTFKEVKAGWTAGAGVEGTIGCGWTAGPPSSSISTSTSARPSSKCGID